MLELALTVCSIVSGASCKDVSLPFFEDGTARTPYSCMMYGQVEIIKYLESHPNHYVSRWRCERAGLTAKI